MFGFVYCPWFWNFHKNIRMTATRGQRSYVGRTPFFHLRTFAVFSRIPTFTRTKSPLELPPADSPQGYATYFVRGNHNIPLGLQLQLQQLTRWIRHLGSACALHGRKYLASRIGYYANSDRTFHQTRLLTSGDVSLNPGPTINSSRCSVCIRNVARNHQALNCDQYELWCHMKSEPV